MRSWPALLIAPLLALGDQTVAYALAEWGCEKVHPAAGHFSHAAFFILAVLLTWMAATTLRRAGEAPREDALASRPAFVAKMGLLVGALSALVIAGMWIAQGMLSPCFS
jgi:hypothetical protein